MPRQMAGASAGSNGRVGLSRSCFMYQSVSARARHTPLPDLMVVRLGISVVAQAEAGPEVHVGDQAEAGHQEQREQQPPASPVAAVMGEQPAQAEAQENQGEDGPEREDSQRPGQGLGP